MEQSLFLGRIENPIQLQSCLGNKDVYATAVGGTTKAYFNVPELFCRLRKVEKQLSNFSKTNEINV